MNCSLRDGLSSAKRQAARSEMSVDETDTLPFLMRFEQQKTMKMIFTV